MLQELDCFQFCFVADQLCSPSLVTALWALHFAHHKKEIMTSTMSPCTGYNEIRAGFMS